MKKYITLFLSLAIVCFFSGPVFSQFENEEDDVEQQEEQQEQENSMVLQATGYDWVDHEEPVFYNPNANLTSLGDDSAQLRVDIGFTFNFYGREYSRVNIGSNGLLTLGDYVQGVTSYITPGDLPNLGAPHATVAVYWDDLVITGGALVYETIEDAERGKMFVVTWDSVRYFYWWWGWDNDDYLTFQVILHESGDVTMQYKNIPNFALVNEDDDSETDDTGDDDDYENSWGGPIPLIGLENEDSTQGTTYDANELSSATAISTFAGQSGDDTIYRISGSDRQGNQLPGSGSGCFIRVCSE